MADQFPPIPAGSTVRQNADGSWQYRIVPGPWCDMPAPQKAAPWADCPSPHQPEPQSRWQPIDPGKEAMAMAVGRELRRHDV